MFSEAFDDVGIAEPKAQLPPDGHSGHLVREAVPTEGGTRACRQSSTTRLAAGALASLPVPPGLGTLLARASVTLHPAPLLLTSGAQCTRPQHDPTKPFSAFTFTDIRAAKPPDQRGLYVIRVKQQGTPVPNIVRNAAAVIQQLQWPMVEDKMLNRIARLHNIGECPVLYIGSAGTRTESRNTLRGRYEEFAGRHTSMFPLWALLYFGWNLEYGWKIADAANTAEAELKQVYQAHHNGKLPALVNR